MLDQTGNSGVSSAAAALASWGWYLFFWGKAVLASSDLYTVPTSTALPSAIDSAWLGPALHPLQRRQLRQLQHLRDTANISAPAAASSPWPSPQHPSAVRGLSPHHSWPRGHQGPQPPHTGEAKQAIEPFVPFFLRPHTFASQNEPSEKQLCLRGRRQGACGCFWSWRWILPFLLCSVNKIHCCEARSRETG